MLAVYLEGRLFTVDSILKDSLAAQKYTLFVKNKQKQVQTSFVTSMSSPYRSDNNRKSGLNLQLSRSAIFGDGDSERDELPIFGKDTSFELQSPGLNIKNMKKERSQATLKRLQLKNSTFSIVEDVEDLNKSKRLSRVGSKKNFSGENKNRKLNSMHSNMDNEQEQTFSSMSDDESSFSEEIDVFDQLDFI